MKVVFRADAGPAMGSGHVMRSLTLARELARQSHECQFVCRVQSGDMSNRIEQEFPVLRLAEVDRSRYVPLPDDTPHAAWAGVDQQTDAEETAAIVGTADWLVVDHYAFDRLWDRVARRCADRLMVLDDLANRPHDCDVLLDQSLGRTSVDYSGLVPPKARLLLGPAHVLLRPEFADSRAQSLRARRNRPVRHILIAMGGLDADNSIVEILKAIASLPFSASCEVSIAISSRAPHFATLEDKANRMGFPVRLCVDEADMAGLMIEADIAVSASGLTAYELSCMGVPMLLLPVSKIQTRVAAELERCSMAVSVPDWQQDRAHRIGDALANFLRNMSIVYPASDEQVSVFDGQGALRVVAAMTGQADA